MKKFLVVIVLLAQVFALAAGESKSSSDSRSFNIQTSPIALLIGMVNGELDYKINENIVVGPVFAYWNATIFDVKVVATSFGAQAKYYPDGLFTDGYYFGGKVASSSFELTAEDDITGDELSAEASGAMFGVMGGYHWFWESFNINLGLLMGSNSVGKVEVKDSNGNVEEEYDSSGVATGLIFNMGFVF